MEGIPLMWRMYPRPGSSREPCWIVDLEYQSCKGVNWRLNQALTRLYVDLGMPVHYDIQVGGERTGCPIFTALTTRQVVSLEERLEEAGFVIERPEGNLPAFEAVKHALTVCPKPVRQKKSFGRSGTDG